MKESHSDPAVEGVQPEGAGAPPPPVPPRLPKTLGQKLCIGGALLLLGGSVAGLLVSCMFLRRPVPQVPSLPQAPEDVRIPGAVSVVIASTEGALTVESPAGGTWYGLSEEGVPEAVKGGSGPWTLRIVDGALALDGAPLEHPVVDLDPEGELFKLGQRSYRGRLLVRPEQGSRLVATNVVVPEDYLRSVVGSEMYSRWPLHALMAQAVAARTYMVSAVERRGRLTLVDMAYGGVAAETGPTDLAVELTRGITMTYRGRVLPAYFHSTCGGHTVPAEKFFNEEPITPLGGVPCVWCRRSHHYRWTRELPAAQIAGALADRGVEAVRTILPQGGGADGYARTVLLNGERELGAYAFRLDVGADVLKSTRFEVSRRDGRFVFEGGGYGHGVGLCQWGAFGLARAGSSWEEILHYYYPGAEIQRVY